MACVRSVPADVELIQGCLDGEEAAWRQLYERYIPHVQARTRKALGPWGRNAPLVEDIAHEVLVSLWVDDCQRLRLYDARRSRLATFLGVQTGRVIRDRVRQLVLQQAVEEPLGDRNPVEPNPIVWAEGVLLEEIAARLTPRERAFFETCLLGKANAESGPFSSANAWKMRQRIREEIEDILDHLPLMG